MTNIIKHQLNLLDVNFDNAQEESAQEENAQIEDIEKGTDVKNNAKSTIVTSRASEQPAVSIKQAPIKIGQVKFNIGELVLHRNLDFHGIIFDIDLEFNHSEDWYQSIPEKMRPLKRQPFYHLVANNKADESYIAYVSEDNLIPNSKIYHHRFDHFYHPKLSHFFKEIDGKVTSKHQFN